MKLTTYTQNQKLEALKLWLVTGNLTQVAAVLKIPYDTVKTWRYSKWWEETSVEIKADGRLELSAKLRKIAEKALDETLDRLENGDVRISPLGTIQRVPVSAAVASKVATDFIEKQEQLDSIPVEQSVQGVNDKLKALAEAFTKMSKQVRRIEVEDAIQIEGPSEIHVCEASEDSEGVREEDTFDVQVTEEEKEE